LPVVQPIGCAAQVIALRSRSTPTEECDGEGSGNEAKFEKDESMEEELVLGCVTKVRSVLKTQRMRVKQRAEEARQWQAGAVSGGDADEVVSVLNEECRERRRRQEDDAQAAWMQCRQRLAA
jgi:hypothetical protein